jgi:hypothetical protein
MATKRTQSKPIKAIQKLHWPRKNEEMCHLCHAAGDETNPLRRVMTSEATSTKLSARFTR